MRRFTAIPLAALVTAAMVLSAARPGVSAPAKIVKATRGGFLRRITVMYYEWAGFGHARVIAGGTVNP